MESSTFTLINDTVSPIHFKLLSNFNNISFDNTVQSLKIEGNCCWTILMEPNYRGDSIVLMMGEYDRNTADIEEIYMKASSARNKCF